MAYGLSNVRLIVVCVLSVANLNLVAWLVMCGLGSAGASGSLMSLINFRPPVAPRNY